MDPIRVFVGIIQIVLSGLATAVATGLMSTDPETLATILAIQNAAAGAHRLRRNGKPPTPTI